MDINTQDLQERLQKNKKGALEFQKRRHDDWTENYTLYRDKVIINRLTQRQSVNIPLMKETIRTVLSQIDDAPSLSFEELGNDKQKELFLNEYYRKNAEDNHLDVKDIVDKKQELLYGRTFKKLNVVDGAPYLEILDPYDVLVDQFVDPTDMDTAQFVIHQNIFRKLEDIASNPEYDQKAIARLKAYYSSEEGLNVSGENAEAMKEKNERMTEMGATDINEPEIGSVYVELNEHYVKLADKNGENEQIYVITTCEGEGTEILLIKPLEEILGETADHYWQSHYPIMSWADDVERSDFWSDGIADITRTPNKVLNSWFSQLVENRTLRNFGMNYYDATIEGFVPATFDPKPFGWYPVPGKPQDVFQKVDIPDLSESLDEMQFLINLNERATAATNIEQGVTGPKTITLGEVQILASKSQERMKGIAKFYQNAWKDFGKKWVKLVEAQGDNLNAVKLYKKSVKGNFFEKTVKPSDWQSEVGYLVKVESSAEQESKSLETIQRLSAVVGQMPNNIPLKKIYQQKLLDLAGLSPDEAKEVMQFSEQASQNPEQNVNPPTPPATQTPITPTINVPQQNVAVPTP